MNQSILIDLFRTRPEVLTLMVLFRARVSEAEEGIERDLPSALNLIREHIVRNETSMRRETGA